MYAIYFTIFTSIIRDRFEKVNKMWITEIPDPDRIYKMCLLIYISREFQFYYVEEYTFQKLNFIMRSTEVIVAISRERRGPYDGRFILL